MFGVSMRRRVLPALAAGAAIAGGMVLGAGPAQAGIGPNCGAWTEVGPDLAVRTCVDVHPSSLEVWTEIQNSTDGNQFLHVRQYSDDFEAQSGECYLVISPGTQGLCGKFWGPRHAGHSQSLAKVESSYDPNRVVVSPYVGT